MARFTMHKLTIIKQEDCGIKQYHLGDTTVKLKIYGCLLAFSSFVFMLGFFAAPLLATDSTAGKQKIKDLQSRVESGQIELDDLKNGVQNDIDSMSLQIGRLMAQSNRLNALGGRLTTASEINLDEFDFDLEPGLGGPELALIDEINTPKSIYENLFNLEQSFGQQQQHFDILSRLLNEQSVEQNVTPHLMPMESGWISSHYGKRIDPFNGKQVSHSGMDYAGAYNSKIRAAADGIVVWAGTRGAYGKMVEIDHGNGFVTRYGHTSSVDVKLGQRVAAGEYIATMGKTGRATSEHVHFEILKNGQKVNPLPFVQS